MSPPGDAALRLPPAADRPGLAGTLRTRGFLVLPGALPEALRAELAGELAEVTGGVDPGDEKTVVVDPAGRVRSVHGLDRRSGLAFDVARHPDLLGLARDLLGQRVVPFLTEYYEEPSARSAERPPHQDQAFRQEHFWDELAVTFWCPLTDVTADDAPPEFAGPGPAPTVLLPHRDLGPRPFSEKSLVDPPARTFEPVPVRAGDMLVYHAYAVWRVRPGRADRPRKVFATHYRSTPER